MLPTPRSSAKPVSAFPLNGPLWSLTFEFISNLTYAAVARRLTTPVLLIFAGATSLVLVWASLSHGGLHFGMAWAPESLLGLVRVFCPFTIGLLLFRFAGHFQPASTLLSLLAAALLIGVLWAPVQSDRIYDVVAVLVAFPAIILLAMRSPDDGPMRAIWSWLGGISYPIYAINQPFFRIAATVRGDAAAGIVSLLLCVVAAHFILRWYDQPIRDWIGRRWLRRKAYPLVSTGDDKQAAGM